MKVLLVVKSKVMENLGVMYLSSVIKKAGSQCRIVDINEAFQVAYEWEPMAIGYSIMTGDKEKFRELNEKIQENISTISIVGGADPTFFPTGYEWADHIVRGEAEQWFADFLGHEVDYGDINSIPHPDRSDFPGMKIRDFISSRGCGSACLVGSTMIHTIDGDFQIKDLEGKGKIKVLSRDPVTEEPVYVDAINIRKTRENADLVRVNFHDGTHIDCTPDHQFKVFRYKNQYDMEEREFDIEAKDLLPRQQIRAVRLSSIDTRNGRMEVSTRRNINRVHAQVVMEAIIGRKLGDNERVHHKDRIPSNDLPYNLVLTTKNRHIPDWHPEVSQRMKDNNPIKLLSHEQLSERAKKIFGGRKQSLEERLKRREMQLGEKNSHYKSGCKHQNKPSRIPQVNDVNHKVVSVEPLPYKEDVYCMEVPGIHWFYANDVLVHNCGYCYNSTWYKLFPEVKRIRVRKVDDVIKEILHAQPEFCYFQDSCFGVNMNWMREFSKKYGQEVRVPYHCHLRPEQCTEERVLALHDSNCVSVKIALETGSDRLRKLINRGKTNNEDAFKACRMLRKWDIAVIMQNILGLPTATMDEDLGTLEQNIRCKPSYSWVSIFQPYPKTELADKCEKEGWYKGDYSEIGDNFFDKSLLSCFTDEHKEHIEVLQKIFALCVDKSYVPKEDELTWENLPKLIHRIMRVAGDKKMFPGIDL